jgi:hypothetical protein
MVLSNRERLLTPLELSRFCKAVHPAARDLLPTAAVSYETLALFLDATNGSLDNELVARLRVDEYICKIVSLLLVLL